MRRCMLCIVSGRVQGVFFRASTQEQALRLKICGWARNLPNGGVEVLACGEEAAVDKLRSWLRHGPRMAQVTKLDCQPAEDKDCPTGFETG